MYFYLYMYLYTFIFYYYLHIIKLDEIEIKISIRNIRESKINYTLHKIKNNKLCHTALDILLTHKL